MKILFSRLLLVFAFVFSCAGTFAQSVIKVACVGNSITEGYGLKKGETYPEFLQQKLGSGYEVRNYGIGGRTMLRKGDFPYWNEAKYKDVLAWNPDIVIIKLGTNDSKPQNWKYKDEFRQDYIDFVNSFKNLSSHPKIYLCYPLPVFENKWGITASIVKDEIIPAVKKIARKTHSKKINLYKPFVGKADLTYDKVHPNEKGTALLADEVYKAIKP